MGLFDGNGVAGRGLPVSGEGGVVFDVELAGRVVGDVEQLRRLSLGTDHGGQGEEGEAGEFREEHRRWFS